MAIPIIMGQNIGTCITAVISSVGASRNGKRTSFVHLAFNVIGSLIWMAVFCIGKFFVDDSILENSTSPFGIAIVHTLFNFGCVLVLLPMSKLIEKLAYKFIPIISDEKEEEIELLDERLLSTPSISLHRVKEVVSEMQTISFKSLKYALDIIKKYDENKVKKIYDYEDKADKYEDTIGTFLVNLSKKNLSGDESRLVTLYLKSVRDFERIADHAKNIMFTVNELKNKDVKIPEIVLKDLSVLSDAIDEIMDKTESAFISQDENTAMLVEPLEEVVDDLIENFRIKDLSRVKQEKYSVRTGFAINDILTDIERVSDHLSNVCAYIIDIKNKTFNTHKVILDYKMNNENFKNLYNEYKEKYKV